MSIFLRPQQGVPWLCIGDFNDILSPIDKQGGNYPDLAHMMMVNQTCERLHLTDVGSLQEADSHGQITGLLLGMCKRG